MRRDNREQRILVTAHIVEEYHDIESDGLGFMLSELRGNV